MAVTLAIIKNPFDVRDRDIERIGLDGPCTLSAFLDEHVKIADDMEHVASINGRVYSGDEIAGAMVAPGDFVAVCPVLRGGGGRSGGKNPLAILAGIALAAFSFGVVAPGVSGIFGGSAIAGKLAGGLTLMVGGQLISNAFAPKLKESEDTESYRWGALQPITAQGAVIPITYGEVRTAGQVINQYIRVDDDVQYMELLLCGGQGPIDAFSDIRINDNPADNYQGVTYDTRPGSNTQTPIEGFENLYDTQYVGVTLKCGENSEGKEDKNIPGEWFTAELEGDAVDYIEVTLDFPEGMGWYPETRSGPEKHWVKPEFQYSIRNADGSWGAWVPWFMEEFEGATAKPFTRVRRTDKLPSGKYRVRGRMNAKDGVHPTKDKNTTTWSSLTSVIASPMVHPGKALLGIKVQATDQLNNGMPTVTWRQTRGSVLVYQGGQWVKKDARNPAWIIYDLCVQARELDGVVHVFGEQPERMDLTAFSAWAAWNEQTLGNRGPIRMNLLVDESKDLWSWVNDIAASARGAVVLRGTKISCIWDQPSDPVQLFTMGNIVAGSFSGEFLGVDGRANAVEISFLNAAKNFEREQMTVYAHDFDDTDTRANPVAVDLVGITDFDQAWQEGLYRLKQNRYILRTITFQADIDAIACQVGDVILVQHDVPRWGQGGRILEINGNNVKVDHQLEMSPQASYNIIIRTQDDKLVYRTATGSGTTDTITISNAGGLAPYDVFAIGEMQAVAKPFRVQEMSRSGDLYVTLTCTEYIAALYTEDGIPPIIDYSTPTNRIAGLTLNAGGYYSSTGQWVPELWANWSYRGKKPATYEVEWKYDQGVWEQHQSTSETTAQAPLRETVALYSVRVRALYVSDPPSDWAYATSEGIVLGNGIPPDPPTGLTAEGMFGFALLNWTNPVNADLAYIEVWENTKDELMSATLVGQTRANTFTRMIPAGGALWYWVRAVNYTGQKSEYNSEAGTPCIVDPESAEAWLTDYIEKNPWIKDVLNELNERIEPIEIDLEAIKNEALVDLEGRIKDNEDRILQNIEPALDLVSAGVLRLADQADYVGDVFRWAGMDIYPDEGRVVIRALEDLKTETGYQFSEVKQTMDAQEANINLKASRVYVDELAASLISGITVAQEWDFKGDLHGWTGQNAELTAEPQGIKYVITDASPSMTSPSISIDGNVNNIIGLQFQQTLGDPNADVRIQYSTTAHGFSDEYMKRVDVLGSIDIMRSVQVNMHSLTAGGDDWKNSTITGLRLLIGDTIADEYLISLINIGQSSIEELMLQGLEMRITQAEADIDGANAAIALKADETTVKGLQQQLNSAQVQIDAINSIVALKADRVALDGVEARLRTAEIEIDALDGGITQQVLDYQLLQDQINDLSDASLQNSVNEHEGQEERRVKLAKATQELNARIDENGRAISEYRLELLSVIDENKAYYEQQITAIADDLSAEVGRREILAAEVADNQAAILNEANVRATADQAEANARQQLDARVGTNSASIQTQQQAIARLDGYAAAKYAVKLDVNGYVSGVELFNGGDQKSTFVISADSFVVAKPGCTSPKQMLIYDSATGQLVLNSLMVNRTAIIDASINSAKIADAAITNAKIGNAQIDALKVAGQSLTKTSFSQSAYEMVTNPAAGVWTFHEGLSISVNTESGTPTDVLMVTGLDCSGRSIDLGLFKNNALIVLVPYFRNNTVDRISATYAFRDNHTTTGITRYQIAFRYSRGGSGNQIRSWSRTLAATSILR